MSSLNNWIRSRPIFGKYGTIAVWFIHGIIIVGAIGLIYGLFFGS